MNLAGLTSLRIQCGLRMEVHGVRAREAAIIHQHQNIQKSMAMTIMSIVRVWGSWGEGQVPLVGLVLWQRLVTGLAWADTLTFKSEVLPIGTPIRFNVSISLHVSVSPELEEQGNGASTELYIYRPLDYPTFGDPFHPLHPLLSLEILDSTGYSTKTYTFHGFLGDDIGLAQYLEVGAIPDIDRGLVDVDARNTALFAINGSPQVFITSRVAAPGILNHCGEPTPSLAFYFSS